MYNVVEFHDLIARVLIFSLTLIKISFFTKQQKIRNFCCPILFKCHVSLELLVEGVQYTRELGLCPYLTIF